MTALSEAEVMLLMGALDTEHEDCLRAVDGASSSPNSAWLRERAALCVDLKERLTTAAQVTLGPTSGGCEECIHEGCAECATHEAEAHDRQVTG